MVVLSHHDSRWLITTIAATFGGLAVIATFAFGSSLGYRRQWGYLAWSLLLGVAATGLVIFFAFDGSLPANAPDDQNAGDVADLGGLGLQGGRALTGCGADGGRLAATHQRTKGPPGT
jgi:hypothetical protein